MEKPKKFDSRIFFEELKTRPEALKELGRYLDKYHQGWEDTESQFFKKVAEALIEQLKNK